jgi:uncharacterized SAM-binding protein YcdF (DUF218 family)
MFVLKKLLTPFLLPPGLFIVILFIFGGFYFFKRQHRFAGLLTGLAVLIWMSSIGPVASFLMRGLESDYAIPDPVQGDVILLLGGGIHAGVADMSGIGRPTDVMNTRVITAVRLYERSRLPIIVSGGRVFPDQPAEAPIIKRILIDLGVPGDHILVEGRARDTAENARFIKILCQQHRFQQPIVITSASHLKRAMHAFEKVGVRPQPYPAGFMTTPQPSFAWHDYLPSSFYLRSSATAMHEFLGIIYHRLVD